jgi:hypothetical protein
MTKGAVRTASSFFSAIDRQGNDMTRSAEIDIEMMAERDPDAHPNDYLFQNTQYRDEDEARLKAWCNDEWDFVGIRAKATIKIPFGIDAECWIVGELLTPGLWGIESDSGAEYFQRVFQEEREILLNMLDALMKECRVLVRP